MGSLKTKNGEIQEIQFGSVRCKKYIGKFHSDGLQSKANAGKWYTLITGNPYAIEGEGDNPQDAMQDAIRRTQYAIDQMQLGINVLQSELGKGE